MSDHTISSSGSVIRMPVETTNMRAQIEYWTEKQIQQSLALSREPVTYSVSVTSNVTPIGMDVAWLIMLAVRSRVIGAPPIHTSLLVADFFPEEDEYRSHIAEALGLLLQQQQAETSLTDG